MPNTDWFWLNQESTDWPDTTEELRDFQTSGNSNKFVNSSSNSKTASALVSAWDQMFCIDLI